MPPSRTRSLTIRLPQELYGRASHVARSREMSLNQLIREGLDTVLRVAEERARYDAYTLLGSDPDTNADYAEHAQAEAMLTDGRE